MGYFNFPRLTVLQGIYEDLAPICATRFITSRPASVPERVKEYVVIRNATGMRDRGDTYQSAKILLHVFVRDRDSESGKIENTYRLEQLQSQICDLFPVRHPRFTASNPNIIGGGEDAGFHYLIIQLSIIVNKKSNHKKL